MIALSIIKFQQKYCEPQPFKNVFFLHFDFLNSYVGVGRLDNGPIGTELVLEHLDLGFGLIDSLNTNKMDLL